jgi:hypothetical protein
MEDTLSANNSSMLDDLRDVSWANINSILDSSKSRSFQKPMDDKSNFFDKFKDSYNKKKKKKKKEEKEIERINTKVKELVGEASISSFRKKLKPQKKRKKINIRKIIKDFKGKFPEEYFQDNFDLHSFFKNFKFDATDYHKMVMFLIKYADRSEVSINFLIWEKKQSLMNLMTKIFQVSNLLSQSKNTFYDTRIRFMTFVTQRAEKFIRKRNLQMKRVRLKLYLSLTNWLKKVRDVMKSIKAKLQGHCIDGIFNDYNHLVELLEKKISVNANEMEKKETTQTSIDEVMSKFKERFRGEFNELKKTIARLFLDRFRYHFKEFLLIDLSQHIPPKTRQNLFKFLAGSEFSPSWQSQKDTREMWNPENFNNILDNNFMKHQFENQKEVFQLTKDIGSYITTVHPYPDTELTSLTSLRSISFNQSLGESQDFKKSNRKLSASILGETNISLQDHALIVSKLFVILNQLMIFDTGIFSNEIMGLFNPLSKQLRSELFKLKNNTDVEEIKKVVSPKFFKIKLVNDYFNMLWSFQIRLLLLIKINTYGIIACSRNKGVLITEKYITKILGDSFFLLNNVGKRVILVLKEYIEELFKHGVNFDELLGLKKIFINIYNISNKQLFANLAIAEENFNLSGEEVKKLEQFRKKISPGSFFEYLWKIELFCINSFTVNSLKNLSTDVENENWQDLNVSFDIVDMLRFILNSNNFVKKLIANKMGRELIVESENTLLKIEQKQFR